MLRPPAVKQVQDKRVNIQLASQEKPSGNRTRVLGVWQKSRLGENGCHWQPQRTSAEADRIMNFNSFFPHEILELVCSAKNNIFLLRTSTRRKKSYIDRREPEMRAKLVSFPIIGRLWKLPVGLGLCAFACHVLWNGRLFLLKTARLSRTSTLILSDEFNFLLESG